MKSVKLIIMLLFAALLLSCGVVEKLANRDPVIKNISSSRSLITVGDTVMVSVTAEDPDEDELTYSWECTDGSGSFKNHTAASTIWTAPTREDDYTLKVTVRDKNEGKATEDLQIKVVSDTAPKVAIIYPQNGDYLVPTENTIVRAEASPATYIDKIEFYIDDQLLATDTTVPYTFDWNMQGYSGDITIKVRAFRSIPSSSWSDDLITVSVQGVVPIP